MIHVPVEAEKNIRNAALTRTFVRTGFEATTAVDPKSSELQVTLSYNMPPGLS
ncbi:MAG: hypothetical protein WA874_14980 [Chryseosolibacter sp.]